MNRLGRAMADPTRSRILLSLLAGPGYPAELARQLDLTRTNVSNHLTCLRGCGIIIAEPEVRKTRYRAGVGNKVLRRVLGISTQTYNKEKKPPAPGEEIPGRTR